MRSVGRRLDAGEPLVDGRTTRSDPVGVRAASCVTPNACFHCSWSYVRANALTSTSVLAEMNHSGKYSCAVASLVKSRGATGSPLKTTVVTPAAFNLVITCVAVAWIVAGSSW